MIARKSLLIMTQNVISGVFGYVALFFIARYMSVEDYGIIGFALSFAMMFSIIYQLGFHAAHLKRVSEGKDLGECIGTFFALKILLTIAYVATVFGAIFVWTDVIGRGFESQEHFAAIIIMVAYSAFASLGQTMKVTFQARKEIAKHQIPFLLHTVIRTVATIAVALSGEGALHLAFTYILAEIVAMAVNAIFFRNYKIKRPTKEMFKSYRTFALPMVISGTIGLIITNSDKVFIQLFWNSTEVGYYFAPYTVIKSLTLATTAIGVLLFPTISKLHANKDSVKIENLVKKAERYSSMLLFPVVFFIIAFPRPIIHIMLDDSYYPAIPIFQILPLWLLFRAIGGPYGQLMIGINRPWINTYGSIINVVLNISLNLILIPVDIKFLGLNGLGLGATGAAIATIITLTIGLIYTRIMVWRFTGITWNPRVLIHLLAAGGMVLGLNYITSYFYIVRWYHLLSVFFLGIGIYLGILIILREFKKEDYLFFMDTINPKEMLSYIVDEIRGKK